MEAPEFDARHERLLRTLDDLVALLHTAGAHQHWEAWLTEDRRRIADGDRDGLVHLVQAYGGMGSLNDLPLTDDQDVRTLTSLAYEDAVALMRDLGAQ